MYSPKISVIVPVYKAEKFISRCIESILNQSYYNLELLLIDDGSPDNSGIICENYASIDSRVRVFHKKNGGVSSARNCGLDNANGDLIFFCDSDDWISPHLFDSCVYNEKYDIVQLPRNMGSNFQNYSKNIYCENKNGLTRFLCENFTYEIWGKLYRRDIIDEIRFPLDISIGEDVIFLLEIYKNIKNYCIVSSENKYYYNDENQNSLMSTQVKVNSDEIMIMGLLNRNQLHWSLAYFFISSYYWHLCLKNENILIAYWKSIPLSKLSYFSLPIKCVIKIIILCINGLYLSIKWKKIN